MNKIQHLINRILSSTTLIMSGIGAIFILFMTLLTTADVILRYGFNRPISGAHEVIEFMMIFAVFFGLAFAQYKKANINVDIVVGRLPRKAREIISVFSYILSFGIIGVITYQAFVHLKFLWKTGRHTSVLEIPLYPSQFVLALGCLMLLVVLFLDIVYSIFKRMGQ